MPSEYMHRLALWFVRTETAKHDRGCETLLWCALLPLDQMHLSLTVFFVHNSSVCYCMLWQVGVSVSYLLRLLVLAVVNQAQLFVVHIHTGLFKRQCKKFRMTKDHGGGGFNRPSKWCWHLDKWGLFYPLFSTTGYLFLLPEDSSYSSPQSTCCSGFLCPCIRGQRGERIRNPPISMNRQTPPTHAHGKAHLSHCFAASEWAQINSVTIKGLW